MSPRARALIGVVTTIFFLGTGVSLIIEGQSAIGGVLAALGLLRGAYAFAQVRDAWAPDED